MRRCSCRPTSRASRRPTICAISTPYTASIWQHINNSTTGQQPISMHSGPLFGTPQTLSGTKDRTLLTLRHRPRTTLPGMLRHTPSPPCSTFCRFADSRLNWAENLLRCRSDTKTALVEASCVYPSPPSGSLFIVTSRIRVFRSGPSITHRLLRAAV